MLKISTLSVALALAFSAASAFSGEVEVLHYWTSGGEAKSVAELKAIMQAKGHTWKDFAVAGGGGDNAGTVLKSRVVAGNPPSAAQLKGPAIAEWAAEGVLANLDSVATAEQWDKLLPPVVANAMKYKNSYVSVPVNVHRVNWMWANAAVLKRAGVDTMPKNWGEFFTAADKINKVGLIPLALGGQNWQELILFESVVLGVGGPKFYNDAFVQLDSKALLSETMKKSLETFRKLKSYTDKASPSRDWNLTTALVMNEKAGFQFMGDWAKGEFLAAGKVPNKDFLCAPAPGTANAFTFNVDAFAMFKLKDATNQKAQAALATAIMGPEFQEVFNLNKGSIPVRLNMSMDKFDECAKASSRDFISTAKSGGLVPSLATSNAVKPAIEGAFKDAVSHFWNDDSVSIAQGLIDLDKAAKTK